MHTYIHTYKYTQELKNKLKIEYINIYIYRFPGRAWKAGIWHRKRELSHGLQGVKGFRQKDLIGVGIFENQVSS